MMNQWTNFPVGKHDVLPVPVTARFKAWVCGRWPAKIVGSNPTGGMYICLLYTYVLCVVR
jgi:hypothetical protein